MIVINRFQEDKHQTLGQLSVFKGDKIVFQCCTLELPNKGNKRNVSRIPAGEYKAIKHWSPKFGETLWLQDVEDRSEILIHQGNYRTQIRGCILVGASHKDIDGDSFRDVTSSVRTLRRLLKVAGDTNTVKIIDVEEEA